MGLFDVFTGKPQKEAGIKTRGFLDQMKGENLGFIDRGYGNAMDNIRVGVDSATDYFNEGRGRSLGDIGGGYRLGRDALTGGYNAGLNSVNSGYTDSVNALDAGGAGARNALTGARGAYDSLAALGSKYGGATSLYLDSLGANGAEGTDRARGAFTPSLSYDFNLNQGLEAINRRRNAGGMVNSGNADRDAQEYGAGLASREFGSWQDRLAGLINPELAATSGAASGRSGVDVRMADLETAMGRDRANLATGRAGMLADLSKAYGGGMANSFANEGTALAGVNSNSFNNLANLNMGAANTRAGLDMGAAGMRVGVNNQIMNPYIGTYQKDADASMQGSKNLWDFGMNAAKLAASAATGMPMGGGSPFGGGSSQGLGGNPNQSLAGYDPSGNFYNFGGSGGGSFLAGLGGGSFGFG
jgi:hypothetical protein